MHTQSTFLVGSFGVLGGFNFGYNTGIIAAARDLILEDYRLDPEDSFYQALATSSVLLGAMVGSFGGGVMANKYGRKVSNVVGSALCILGLLCGVLAPDIWTFAVFRVVLGCGIGITAVVCPMYVSEMAPPEKRGTLGVLFQLALTFAIFLSALIGWGCTKLPLTITYQWRIMVGLGILIPVALFVLTLIKMLDSQGNVQETQYHETAKPPCTEICTDHKLRVLLLTDTMLACILQLTGINAVMYYGPLIIKQAGLGDALAVNIITVFWNFLSTIVAILAVDRVGRRPLMLAGTALLSLALVAIGVIFQVSFEDQKTKGICVCIGLAAFILGFEVGPGCLFWVIVNELFPKEHIETGAAYANVLQWAFNLLVSSLYPILTNDSPLKTYGTFYLFGAIGCLSTVYCFFMLPETKSKEDEY